MKDSTGEVQINPGLLPLSHGGVCCVDCADKVDVIQPALIEVIERRKLSVAKKGGFDQFDCDTTLLVCVDPRASRLSQKKSLSENFLIDETLLTKFDLPVLFQLEDARKPALELSLQRPESNDGLTPAEKLRQVTTEWPRLMEQVQTNDGGRLSKIRSSSLLFG